MALPLYEGVFPSHVSRQPARDGADHRGAAPAARGFCGRSRTALHAHAHRRAARVEYFSGGTYLPDALATVNHFLRDFRTGDVHEIDPGLLDLLHGLATRDRNVEAVPGDFRLSFARHQRDASAPQRRRRGRQPAHEGAGHRHPSRRRAAGQAAAGGARGSRAAASATTRLPTSSTSTRGACGPGGDASPTLHPLIELPAASRALGRAWRRGGRCPRRTGSSRPPA